MRTCLACHAQLNNTAIRAGICPSCGMPIGQSANTSPSNLYSGTVDLESLDFADDVGLKDATSTVDLSSQGDAAAGGISGDLKTHGTIDLPPEAPDVKHPAAAGAPAGEGRRAEGGAAVGADSGGTVELSPADSGRLLKGVTPTESHRIWEVWGNNLAEGSRPQATLKIDPTTTLGEGTVVIKSRNVAASHDAPSLGMADYELLNEIGQGGMGVVYAARQASFNRRVAIKMLRPGVQGKSKQHEFVSEAVTTGDLDHPNIVPVYDLGTNADGALFYAMKCVQGTPWDDALPTKSRAENLAILMKVADAIAFAHSKGIVHRDLKPENIMLGSFGEVLVMDWGLAVRFTVDPDGEIRSAKTTMGGTPAYMAPELVLGPMERIGPAADVYLLGAILFEIVTGKTPHSGKSAIECLHAAAKNVIEPTDRADELLDIALKAMQTEPKDRYGSVTAFQKAVQEYQSHSESIALLDHARQQLVLANQTNDYQDYARALFGCQEALALWAGNHSAQEEISKAKIAYANCAKVREDYDLAASLLDADDPAHGDLLRDVQEGKREREARTRRLRNAKRIALALIAVVLTVVTTAYFEIRKQRDRAEQSRQRAEVARADEAVARQAAEEAEADAIKSRDIAEERRIAEQQARRNEEQARKKEEQARKEEEEARKRAEAAQRAEQYEAYIARIGLAAAKIEDNAFSDAERLLADCRESEFRHWEWGRLWYLCQQSVETIRAEGPIESVAYSPDGRRALLGSWDGLVRIATLAGQSPPLAISHGGFVHAVAFSHSGLVVASGGNDCRVRVWNAATGDPIATMEGHGDAVVSLAFSPDDRWILSGSYDGTARIWDAATGDEFAVLEGHSWWVWQAAFSPDASRIITASQDGRVMVWSVADRAGKLQCEPQTEFSGHGGPVCSAAFSPDGTQVVSGGYDGRVMTWNPADVKPVDLAARIAGMPEADPPHRTLWGHAASASCVAYSPDGSLIASAGHDNVVNIWDSQSGTLIKTLRGHGGRVRSCTFSPDGLFVLSGSHDGRAMVWSLEGYREVRVLKGRVLEGHTDTVLSARFSSSGDQVVTASRDRTARIWDASRPEMLRELSEGHEFLASSAVFFADGRRMLTAAGDNTVRLWDVAAGTELLCLEGTGRDGALALSHNEQWILAGSTDGSATLFDLGGQLLQRLSPGEAVSGAVTAVGFGPDDNLLLIGDSHGRCQFWARTSENGPWTKRFQRHNHSRRIVATAFLPDGRKALTASLDNTVAQWDLETGEELTKEVLKHPGGVTSLALMPDGKQALTTCDDGRLRLWDLGNAAVVSEMTAGDNALQHVAVSRDGGRALTTNAVDRLVRLWDLGRGREIPHPKRPGTAMLDFSILGGLVWTAVFTPDGTRILSVGGNDARIWEIGSDRELMSFSPHGAVAWAEFSPDGQLVVTASWDNSAKIWDANTGRPLRKLSGGHARYVNSAVFSPDGNTVLTAGDDRTARFWDAQSGQLMPKSLVGHTDRIRRAVFSHTGRRVLTVSDDKTARIWDADSSRIVHVLSGHEWAVLDGAFSHDGRFVVTGSEDNRARLWDAETGEPIRTFEGHAAAVTSVALSPDGRRLLTGSRDHTAKLWDSQTGKEILSLRGHDQEVTSVSFSPSGRQALTSSRDGTAIIYLTADW